MELVILLSAKVCTFFEYSKQIACFFKKYKKKADLYPINLVNPQRLVFILVKMEFFILGENGRVSRFNSGDLAP